MQSCLIDLRFGDLIKESLSLIEIPSVVGVGSQRVSRRHHDEGSNALQGYTFGWRLADQMV